MSVGTFNYVPGVEKKHYVNAGVISEPEAINRYSYFYIGTSRHHLDSLALSFEEGAQAEDLDTAKIKINALKLIGKLVDVIIIDLPVNNAELIKFQAFVKSAADFYKIPLLYNAQQLQGGQNLSEMIDMVDDIIDLSKLQFDLSTKISFLKKLKAYNHVSVKKQVRIKPSTSYFKRALDILISATLLLLLLPLLALIALAVRLESKGPIFYNAKRAGRGFRIFTFYKFRTMVVNADKKIEQMKHLNQYDGKGAGPMFFKINNDPRITKVGKFLRNTSLDELPQLFNVLKGDMSLVGNRPLPLYEAATLTTNDFVERFMAPAGITGLWQIKKRGNSDMSVEERISLDIDYARKNSFLYDLWIMANTPSALFQKSNV